MGLPKLDIHCKVCITGDCCAEGVDIDLEEAKKISQLNLDIEKPWFEDLFPNSDVPSGWAVSSVVRFNRCVFQDENKRCLIYEFRPRYCREFPYEKGKKAPFYDSLCGREAKVAM